jgi:hypothetical protein
MRAEGVRFTKGDPRCGRPKGAKNKLPGGSVRAMCKWLSEEQPELFRDAIVRGLKAREARSFPFVQLAAHYIDGKPVERVQVQTADRLVFVPGGSTPELGA